MSEYNYQTGYLPDSVRRKHKRRFKAKLFVGLCIIGLVVFWVSNPQSVPKESLQDTANKIVELEQSNSLGAVR